MKIKPDVMFSSRSLDCKTPYGAAAAGETVTFSLYPRREQSVQRAALWVERDGEAPRRLDMRWFGLSGARDR